MAIPDTVVHLVRHGEVHNPDGILYGRRDGFHLSDLGRDMAEKTAAFLASRDITVLRSSPLERARETAAPLADKLGLEIGIDARVIESTNRFEGLTFGRGTNALRNPLLWRHLYNPFRPSWGEPYRTIVARMMAAIHDVRRDTLGHEGVIVSHQLPIWTTRLHVERRSFLHDPRRRQCTLCSVTSLHFVDDRIAQVSYQEPAIDLIPKSDRSAPFSAGDAPVEKRPEGSLPPEEHES
ncbi:histidine phosphatase family protein [Nocardioides bizhenqiangii]|uniref:Histidine phosphatase family protein n=1 Tax=Nocardioides bizhenqiangii TaxID=3095076 RepID=A0ABZ0ZRV3_9ACTN|nr:histidine phosphatase family protein [Nocardioides sp. HM61]WQQ26973.1 histidine phosphatase family protein [Nocardioides sp. HM61]